ncbi:HAD hydrolase-like protein [Candidatus Woesearchaeota archaeon]|nr:HAD hydrolase-like protein [Candidatus Woesearchaeota archaeon]
MAGEPFDVYWDFHGVLEKDNEHAVKEVADRVMGEFGLERRITPQEVLDWYGLNWHDYFYNLISGYDSIDHGVIATRMAVYASEIGMAAAAKHIKPNDGARETLKGVRSRGGTNIVVSNTNPANLDRFIDLVGLGDFIDHRIGVPSESAGNGFSIVDYKANRIAGHARSRGSMLMIVDDRPENMRIGDLVGAEKVLYRGPGRQYLWSELQPLLKTYGPFHCIGGLSQVIERIDILSGG